METDARGQLGGLETTDEVRRRFAKESGNWTCSACGKANSELISDCERKYNEETHEATKDVEIPQELKMAFRDELPAVKSPNSSSTTEAVASISPPREQTGPNANENATAPTSGQPVAPNALRNRQANPSTPRPGLDQEQRPNLPQAQVPPLWLDRAIVILSIVLAALLMKVLFGL